MDQTRARWRATYTTGRWLLLAGPTSVVLLEPAPAHASTLVGELWASVTSARSLTDLTDRLAAAGFDAATSMAAFFWSDTGLASLVQGAITVRDAETGQPIATGRGPQSWSEVGLGEVAAVHITGAGEPSDPALRLPMVIGAAQASEVILQAPRPAAGPTVEAEEPVRSAPQPSAAAARGTDDTTAPLEPVDLEQAGLPPVRAADTDEATTPLPGKPQPGPDRPVTDPEATTQSWPAPDALPADPAGADVADEPTAVMPAVTPAGAAPPSSVIMGVLCPQGHSSAPDTRRCRVCGRAVEPQAPRPVPRPSLARLRTSDGALVEVDRPVVIGRAPSEEHAGGALPRLLTVASPHHDISRSHLLVAPDGWTLVATDLRSTNGTLIVWPETGSRKPLEPNEPTPIPLGARLDLGDGITVTVEGLG